MKKIIAEINRQFPTYIADENGKKYRKYIIKGEDLKIYDEEGLYEIMLSYECGENMSAIGVGIRENGQVDIFGCREDMDNVNIEEAVNWVKWGL